MTMQNIGVLQVLAQQAATSTVTGGAVDLQGLVNPGGREMKSILNALSTGADGDETLDVKLQESPTTTPGDFTDIVGATFTQVPQGGAAVTEAIHFQTNLRYIRAIATLAGTTPAFDFSLVTLAEQRLT